MTEPPKIAIGRIGTSVEERRLLAVSLFEKLIGRNATVKELNDLDRYLEETESDCKAPLSRSQIESE